MYGKAADSGYVGGGMGAKMEGDQGGKCSVLLGDWEGSVYGVQRLSFVVIQKSRVICVSFSWKMLCTLLHIKKEKKRE